MKNHTEVKLPISEAEFDELMDQLMAHYKFPNREHAMAVVANRIMHLPPDQATSTMDYLASCVHKNIAYQVAEFVGRRVSHKVQIEDLVKTLTASPNDAQAMDQLQEFANEGSPFAKAELDKMGIPVTPPKTLSVGQNPETTAENGIA